MKGRSHGLPISNPPDDWVEEAWTVDCVCGVTFDDGEEMVNCDECGVWVHTRCSCYVRGEASFHCDKCKTKKCRNDSEETEVAQLLAELPTQTMRMESSCNSINPPGRPFKLLTERPIEERVHVQGIPGGDPAIFGEFKSVFTRELWKCTGYVPKKFNFQYREFPCWEEKQEVDDRAEEENENPVNKGAGVLYSLSKENMLATTMAKLVGLRNQAGSCRKPSLKGMAKCKGREFENFGRVKSSGTKARNLLRSSINSSKQKKVVRETSGDRSGKMKCNTPDGESDVKKRGSQTDKAGRGPKLLKFGPKNIKSWNMKDIIVQDPDNDEKHKNNMASTEHSSEVFSSEMSGHNTSIVAGRKEQISEITDSPLRTDGVALPLKTYSVGNPLGSEEGASIAIDKLDDSGGHCSSNGLKPGPPLEMLAVAGPEIKVGQPFPISSGNLSTEREEDFDNVRRVLDTPSSPHNDVKLDEDNQIAQHPGTCSDHMFENVVINAVVSSSQSSEHNVQDVLNDSDVDKPVDLSGDACGLKCELEGMDSSLTVQKSSLVPAEPTEVPSKLEPTVSSPSELHSQNNIIVSVGKHSPDADNCKMKNSPHQSSVAKRQVMPNCIPGTRKDKAAVDEICAEDMGEISRQAVAGPLKPVKGSYSSKTLHASVSQQSLPDSKDPVVCSSLEAQTEQSVAYTPGEPVASMPTQCPLPAENKIPVSGLTQRGERLSSQSSSLSFSKSNHASSMDPPALSNASTGLSDEELALLLHQELNSSPRVPRVLRARQAGSLPQLASPAAASMLIKRSCSSGGKDDSLGSRRRNKDAAKNRARNSCEIEDDANKNDRLPQQKPDLSCAADDSLKPVHSITDNIACVSTGAANSGPDSSMETNNQNLSSIHNSPGNVSDDDTGTTGVLPHQTLPGLIGEIMSEGKRMAYEDLCNAVLPHWHGLRKHNGERYAYSSHSQAVLDCLRNRSEWSRLVVRGPKLANGHRKRRKVDVESQSVQPEDDGGGKIGISSGNSYQEEFPKGKRKARKRRRVGLQGSKGKHGDDEVEEEGEEVEVSPHSSEGSIFSEDEIQGGSCDEMGGVQ